VKVSRSKEAAEKPKKAKAATGKATARKAVRPAKATVRATRPAARKLVAKQASAKQSATKRAAPKAAAKPRHAATHAQSKKNGANGATSTLKKSTRTTPALQSPPPVDQAARDKELAREHSTTAVNRALSLLETMARTGPVPLAVLADAAGCGKSAALDLLTTMHSRNFVIQDETHGLWRLGARWSVLGSAASEQGALAATAMPYLAALGNATGENVYMRVREGLECETVAIYQTDPGLRVYTEVGKKMPLHAGSGRMLLAHAPEAIQTQVLAQRLQRYTPSTRTDPSWIAADLHRIRQRGFLITDSEVVAGTVSVCAAVRDSSGQVVAAILIGAPSLRMRPPRPRALMPAVAEAARKLSHALGSISEQPASPPPNGQAEPRQLGAFATGAWPSTALGATISRPHSIFRQA
jgi:IclR family KDG regulon transcriptional repressor